MLNKWALVLNIITFLLLLTVLVFQFMETNAYIDTYNVIDLFK